MKIKTFFSVLTTAFVIPVTLNASIVLIDNGGVITHTDTYAALKELGLKDILHYTLILKKNPLRIGSHLRKRFYELLDFAARYNTISTPDIPENEVARDEHGTALPQLMRIWQNGTMSNEQVRMIILKTIALNPNYFIHPVEKRLLRTMTNMIFIPEKFIQTRKLSPEAVQFIKQCKNNGHSVYLLSNWDTTSFELFKKTYPDLCNLFDGIILSGNEHSIKPEKAIYQLALKRYNLDPRECFFFDDQQENITAARNCGINAILCTHPSVLTLNQLPDQLHANQQPA